MLLKNSKVVDSDGERHGDVLIRDGKIDEIDSDISDVDGDDEIYDLDGDYVVPGVIDCHVHLVSECLPTNRHGDDRMRWYRVVDNMEKTLSAGVTTVRDLNAPDPSVIDAGRAVEEGLIDGPRVVACGQGISCTGGHFSGSCREADGVSEVRKAVREQIERDAEVIKLMTTSSAYSSTRGAQEMTRDEIEAAVEVAEMKDVPTAAHAEGKDGILAASEAGVDSVEHCKFADDEAAETLARNGTFWVPTHKPTRMSIENPEKVSDEKLRKAEETVERQKSVVDRMVENGVRVAMGSDAGTSYNYHSENLHELELMSEYGIDEKTVLDAATSNAAELLGIDDEVGYVREGYTADLLVLSGDPLEDVSNWRNQRLVIKDGNLVDS
ncbi:amidohydrolase family protein [Halorutilales archaeon Cl-col2-1]